MKKVVYFFILGIVSVVFVACEYEIEYNEVIEQEYFKIPDVSQFKGKHNNHEYVNLGLPSGTLWATMNVGSINPEDRGNFYGWGETSTHYTYDWSNYCWNYNSYSGSLTKYVNNSSYVDNRTTLELQDDVAHYAWGGDWRMPTKAEMEELISKCTWTWTELNGYEGFAVKGPNNVAIFLPAGGVSYSTYSDGYREDLYYWTSSLNTADATTAYYLRAYPSSLYNERMVKVISASRYYGHSVRPVYKGELSVIPTVSTSAVTNIAATSATCGGNVTSIGSSAVTARGVCWSTSLNPTISDNQTTNGSGIGSFTSHISGLAANTTYYVRAYATNSAGTAYGNQISFATTASSTSSSINDFIGTYSVSAYNWYDDKWESWEGTTIENTETNLFGENTIVIYGMAYGKEYDFMRAIGKYDATNNCIRLFSNWGGGTFKFTGNDSTFRAYFYPIYATNETFYPVTTGGFDGTDECGEIWLKKNTNGTFALTASNTPDKNGRYANGFAHRYQNKDNANSADWMDAYTQVTFTKTSNSTNVAAKAAKSTAAYAPHRDYKKNESYRKQKRNILLW